MVVVHRSRISHAARVLEAADYFRAGDVYAHARKDLAMNSDATF